MRIVFLLLCFPLLSIAQTRPDGFCTEAILTDPAEDAVYDCDTLTVGPGTHVIPQAAPLQHLDIEVLGDVSIHKDAVIVLKGGNGISSSSIGGDPGGAPGPGGEVGGDNFSGPASGQSPPHGGTFGDSHNFATAECGGGGGGAGFATEGRNGSSCAFAAGGLKGSAYDISNGFRGGFGGGAGGSAETNNPIESGNGGGGGGAIWIRAGGNITINGNIDVRGGNGGVGANRSGGGGGGSGGAIRIEASGRLVQNGKFLLSGGTGGEGNGPGARGGNGSAGIFELSDSDNVIEGVGTGAIGLPGGESETLKSSISCGAVKSKENENIFQMIAGFLVVLCISRILARFRRSV